MSSIPGNPFRWSPHGAADCLSTGIDDGDDHAFHGAMAQLSNLVPDPTTADLWVSRPASIVATNFPGFTNPGFISALKVVGTRAYGMIASTRNAGKDEPFVYDIAGNTFITVSGVTSGNSPTSPTSTGAWTPPFIDLVGTYIVVCHPGFDGVSNFVGWLNIANPASPVWSAGNTATNALPSVPVAVAQFNGRAYYLCNPPNANPGALISDSLDPKTRTNAYALTFGNNVPLIACFGLPLSNQLGGIIQSLMVFQTNNVHQITGDPALSNLTLNTLNVAIGTTAAQSICATPQGIAFVAQDGLRFIDFNAKLGDPIGLAGRGITTPFLQAVIPSRISSACNGTTIRISVQNGGVAGNPTQEWWYDFDREVWSGPHTFPNSLADAYGSSFIITSSAYPATLYRSDCIPTAQSTYIENGASYQFNYQTSIFPKQGEHMGEYCIVSSQISAGFDSNSNLYTVLAMDENSKGLDTCNIGTSIAAGGTWGAGIWGSMLWGGAGAALSPRRTNWTKPLVFARMSLQVTGTCAQNVRLGDFFCIMQELNYQPFQ